MENHFKKKIFINQENCQKVIFINNINKIFYIIYK